MNKEQNTYDYITKKLYDYCINKKRIDEDFLHNVGAMLIDCYDLNSIDIFTKQEYASKYVIPSIFLAAGGFDIIDKCIYIDINSKHLKKQNLTTCNIEILMIMLHEFNHAITLNNNNSIFINKQIVNLDSQIKDYIKKIKNNRIEGKKMSFKDILIVPEIIGASCPNTKLFNPVERIAYISQFEMLGQVINNLSKMPKFADEETKNIWLSERFKQYLLYSKMGYRFDKENKSISNSQTYDFYNKFISKYNCDFLEYDLQKINDICNTTENGYSIHDRVLYGLPITKEEYNSINKENPIFTPFVLKKKK